MAGIWTFIIILIVLAFLLVKLIMKNQAIGTKLALYLFILLTLLFGVFYVTNSPDLSSFDSVVSSAQTYVSWLGHAGSNLVKVSGYAFNQNWKAENTNSTTSGTSPYGNP